MIHVFPSKPCHRLGELTNVVLLDMHVPKVRVDNLAESDSRQSLQDAIGVLHRAVHLHIALPLYSRLRRGHFSPHSYLLRTHIGDKASSPWLIAFVDRSRRPETELWLFGSWEVDDRSDEDEIHILLTATLRAVKSLPLPKSIHAPDELSEDVQESPDNAQPARFTTNANHESTLTCGAVHEQTYHILKHNDLLSAEFAAQEIPYQVFIFDIDKLTAPDELPVDLCWHTLDPRHYALVRSTSKITRHDETLAISPSVAILDCKTREPAAWGFVGLDGSLSTLHVMPSYRRRGLGARVCLKLLKDEVGNAFANEGWRIGHSYVAPDNEASIRTAEKAGGVRARHSVYWLRIDLGRI